MKPNRHPENEFLNVGFGNAVVTSRIVAIITPKTASGKRIREEAKESNQLVDVTLGRKIRSIILMDSGHVVLSALNTDTVMGRLQNDSAKE